MQANPDRVTHEPCRASRQTIASNRTPSWNGGALAYARHFMAHRLLVDSTGRAWEVWEVFPEFGERRRQIGSPPVDTGERRHRREYRVPLAEPWINGWLAFESNDEKRRLAPIPSGWDRLSDRELQNLLDGAGGVTVRRPRPPD
jgi:hypothetical protein